MGVSFAIPIELALKVGAELRERGFVTRGRIGVAVQPLTQAAAAAAGLADRRGAFDASVEAGGPAHKAGIAAGDVVLAFGGAPVADDADLARRVADARPGTTARAELSRGGRRLAVDVAVAAAPRDS
jgi:serine protease Do